MLKKMINRQLKLFAFGGIVYGLIEIMWRGKTHWTMVLTGGLCYSLLRLLYGHCRKMKMYKKCLLGSAVITSVEFLCGCIVNIKCRLNVWDYSNCRFNLKGQICPLYSFLWAILCVPVCLICSVCKNKD